MVSRLLPAGLEPLGQPRGVALEDETPADPDLLERRRWRDGVRPGLDRDTNVVVLERDFGDLAEHQPLDLVSGQLAHLAARWPLPPGGGRIDAHRHRICRARDPAELLTPDHAVGFWSLLLKNRTNRRDQADHLQPSRDVVLDVPPPRRASDHAVCASPIAKSRYQPTPERSARPDLGLDVRSRAARRSSPRRPAASARRWPAADRRAP